MFDWMTPQLAGQVAYAEWRVEQVRKAAKDHKVVKHPKTAAKSLLAYLTCTDSTALSGPSVTAGDSVCAIITQRHRLNS